LYVLVDCKMPLELFAQRLREISDAGVDLIQIRDKQADPIQVIKYAREAVDLLDKTRTQVVINDRVDIAATMGVSGVHVGQEDLSVGAARRLLQPSQILGLSTHDLGQVQASIGLGVDYIGCGPTFPSGTKSFREFSGTAFLQAAGDWLRANAPGVPAYAIGGIDPENLPRVIQAGVGRIAVSSCVWNAHNPAMVVEKLRSQLDRI
jgi:thiamine-phosphate pyrophosphorylase